jgi:hypothetical protein
MLIDECARAGDEQNPAMNDSQDRGIAGDITPVKLHGSNPTPSPTSVAALQISPDNVVKGYGPIEGRHYTFNPTGSVAQIEYMFNCLEELGTNGSEYMDAREDVSIDGITARVREIAHKSHSEPVHSATKPMTTENILTDTSVDVSAVSAVAGAHTSTVAGKALTLGSAARVREIARKSLAKSGYYAAVHTTTETKTIENFTKDLYAGDKAHRKLISYITRTRQPRKSNHPLSWKGRIRSATTTQLVLWSHYQAQVNKESLWPPGKGGSKTAAQHLGGHLAHNWARRGEVQVRDHDRPP